ncbi:MAG: RHS repeat-associated core domain-containing protein [Candidatus Riflebacteria bacterium]|nr:RHS repeat-associated core domain-containing protein [Candidatus Riflebacteria bacterium]
MKFKLKNWLVCFFIVLTLIPSCLSACMSENSRQGSTTVVSLFSPGEESSKSAQALGLSGMFTVELQQVSDTWHYGKYYAATLSPHLYTGRRFSPVTGLYNLRNRYYQPKYGRFYSSDPIGFLGGQNRYGYVRNNPLRFVDPYGLCTEQLQVTPQDFVAREKYWKVLEASVEQRLKDDAKDMEEHPFDHIPIVISGINIRPLPRLKPPKLGLPQAQVGNATKNGFGDLTANEVRQIQNLARQTGEDVTVVGSAAKGTRGIKRPVSDIDYLVDPEASIRSGGKLEDLIRDTAPGPQEHGILKGTPDLSRGPAIIFKPNGEIIKIGN